MYLSFENVSLPQFWWGAGCKVVNTREACITIKAEHFLYLLLLSPEFSSQSIAINASGGRLRGRGQEWGARKQRGGGKQLPSEQTRRQCAGVPSCGNWGRQTRSRHVFKPVSTQHRVFTGKECCSQYQREAGKKSKNIVKTLYSWFKTQSWRSYYGRQTGSETVVFVNIDLEQENGMIQLWMAKCLFVLSSELDICCEIQLEEVGGCCQRWDHWLATQTRILKAWAGLNWTDSYSEALNWVKLLEFVAQDLNPKKISANQIWVKHPPIVSSTVWWIVIYMYEKFYNENLKILSIRTC